MPYGLSALAQALEEAFCFIKKENVFDFRVKRVVLFPARYTTKKEENPAHLKKKTENKN